MQINIRAGFNGLFRKGTEYLIRGEQQQLKEKKHNETFTATFIAAKDVLLNTLNVKKNQLGTPGFHKDNFTSNDNDVSILKLKNKYTNQYKNITSALATIEKIDINKENKNKTKTFTLDECKKYFNKLIKINDKHEKDVKELMIINSKVINHLISKINNKADKESGKTKDDMLTTLKETTDKINGTDKTNVEM